MLIAEAAASLDVPDLRVPVSVSMTKARAVAGHGRYYADPLYPSCFVCGTSRGPGDGLRIFPGPVAGRSVWAAPWTPDLSVVNDSGMVRPEVVWAALDCPSGIAAAEASSLPSNSAILLGRMTAILAGLPAVGDQCRVIARPDRCEGRKLTAGSALLGPGGQVLAAARAVWLTVPRPVPPSAVPDHPADLRGQRKEIAFAVTYVTSPS